MAGPVDQESWLRPSGGRVIALLKIMPGARKSGAAGLRAGRLLVRVAAQPEKGRANEELVRYLAGELGLRSCDIRLVAGAASRQKTLSFPTSVEAALRGLAGPDC